MCVHRIFLLTTTSPLRSWRPLTQSASPPHLKKEGLDHGNGKDSFDCLLQNTGLWQTTVGAKHLLGRADVGGDGWYAFDALRWRRPAPLQAPCQTTRW